MIDRGVNPDEAGTVASAPWCERCGKPVVEVGEPQHDATPQVAVEHSTCSAAQLLEPPRYCPGCGRRMKVQVLPDGWRAVCVEHGIRENAAGA